MQARWITLVGVAGIAAALIAGCAPPSGEASAPNVAAPPAPAPIPLVVAAPRTPTAAEVERARAQSRLHVWDTQQQARQVALERLRREREYAAWQHRQQAAARMGAPRPQFTSQPWLLQPRPLRDMAPLPPATAAIPNATPVYDRPRYLAAGTSQVAPPAPRIDGRAQFSNVSPHPVGEGSAAGVVDIPPGLIYVDGYQRSDGSWVRPHFRRAPRR